MKKLLLLLYIFQNIIFIYAQEVSIADNTFKKLYHFLNEIDHFCKVFCIKNFYKKGYFKC